MKSKPTTVGNEKQQNITVEMMTPLPSIQVHSALHIKDIRFDQNVLTKGG